MTRDEFQAFMVEHFDTIRGINTIKGHDYAGDEDALENFKRHAEQLGLTPEQIWGVYAGKHWDAVTTYCREGAVQSEPIEGRLHDVILYCFLLLGLVKERDDMAKAALDRSIPHSDIGTEF